MYLLMIGPLVYEGFKDGTPFTLTSALQAVRGVGGCTILRANGTVAVLNAGSDSVLTHAPSGRKIPRRKVA